MRAKSSPVWNYFSYSGLGKYAECNLCKKELSLGSEIKKRQTTFGLKRHLDYGHQVNWEIQSELNKPEKSTLDSDLILKNHLLISRKNIIWKSLMTMGIKLIGKCKEN